MGLVRVFDTYAQVEEAYQPVIRRNQEIFGELEQRIASYAQHKKPLTVGAMETFGEGLELSYFFLLSKSPQGYFFNGGFIHIGEGKGGPYRKMEPFVRSVKRVLLEQHRSSLGVNIVPLLYTVNEVPAPERTLKEVQDFLEGQPQLREQLEDFFSDEEEFTEEVYRAARDFCALTEEDLTAFERKFCKVPNGLH